MPKTSVDPKNHAIYLGKAISLATENVRNGGGPFGAIVVMPDGTVYEGVNRVTANNDPTAHAEVTAIRNACAGENTYDLTGAVIYSSCEPCPMCLGASLWARLDDIFFAADRHDAADAGFDDSAFYDLMAQPPTKNLRLENAVAPFEEWDNKPDKTEY